LSLVDQNVVANLNSVILKPTGLCNAACTFCYATDFVKKAKSTDYFSDEYKKYIERNNVKNIILTGGEVTLLRNFLTEICEYCTTKNISISLVSNMIDIIKDFSYWEGFFKKYDKLHLTASYQIDLARRNKNNQNISQSEFLSFVKWYRTEIKKRLLVISVVNDDNENSALDNVLLAKEHDYVVSLERQIKIGRASSEYLYPKYYRLLSKIIDLGLWEYEKHTASLVEKGLYHQKYCNFFCKVPVPVIYTNNNNELVETCCDQISTTSYSLEDYMKTSALQKECLLCKYYNMCQGCHITRKSLQQCIENKKITLDDYCEDVKSSLKDLENKLLNIRGNI
jgi:MoaA/NifB/PqqE/SkfB family radical SAM enzyme